MEAISHIFENFNQYLIVGLLIVLFFKESLMAFIRVKLGRAETVDDAPEWGKKATSEINRLAEYANHDTTERLNLLIEMEKAEHENSKETRDILKDIGRTLSEMKEYGIPCRETTKIK
jgi:hypothetical protein